MKPYQYIINGEFIEAISRSNLMFKKLVLSSILKYYIFFFPLLFSFLLYIKFRAIFLICMIFLVCVLSMYPLLFMPWFGFFDMNIILTVFTTMKFGIPAGLLVGTASMVGLLLTGDAENVPIDAVMSYVVVLLSSLFTIQSFIPVVIFVAFIYTCAQLLSHRFMGTLGVLNIGWNMSHLAWIVFAMLKLAPFILKILNI